jgi:phospholipid/cholesterol/gamma-HCH transport system substrate-binding protein
MTKEVKLGLLTIITILIAVWGYKFIKGQDLLHKSTTYYTTFNDVTDLAVSSDVTLNGLKVGTVTKINLNPQNVHQMDVYFRVDGDLPIPKNAEVILRSEGLVGGKLLAINFDKPCSDNDCAEDGSFLKNKSLGLLSSLVDPSEVSSYVDNATSGARELLEDIGKEGNNTKVDLIVRNLELTMANMSKLTNSMNALAVNSNTNVNILLNNLNKITKNLADNNEQISSLLKNLNTSSQQIASADLSKTIKNTDAMLINSNEAVKKLDSTIAASKKSMDELNTLLVKLNDGGGSLGKLINDKKLYDNLESTSKNLSLLLQDLRLNPKRYLNVSLIARKDKPYELPENDPAIIKSKE